MNESRHTGNETPDINLYKAYITKHKVTHMNKSLHTYMNESRHTGNENPDINLYKAYINKHKVTHMNKSLHTYMNESHHTGNENPDINLYKAYITEHNVNDLILSRIYILGTTELDVLSIDIDGMDFYIWAHIDPVFRAKVVIIEVFPLLSSKTLSPLFCVALLFSILHFYI